MQAIAAEFNYSETTFVLPPSDPGHLARVRIFTPRFEMPFAGHPTVGTALVLAWLGRVPANGEFVLEELAGPVPVRLRPSDGPAAFAEFARPAAATHGAPLPARAARGGARARHCGPRDVGRPALRRQLRRAVPAGRAGQPGRPWPGPRSTLGAELPAARSRRAPVHPRDRRRCRRPARPDVRARARRRRGPGDGQRRRGTWRASLAGGRVWPTAGMPGGSRKGSRWVGRA